MYMQQLWASLNNVSIILRVVGHDDVDLMNVSKSPRVVGGVCAVLILRNVSAFSRVCESIDLLLLL